MADPAINKLNAAFHAACMLLQATEPESRPGLWETPHRFAAAWDFWTSGYGADPKDVLKSFEDGAEDYTGMVFQANIPFYSKCEHHLADMFGVAHFGYIPNGKVVGLSKICRLVDIFARRLQVQERATKQISDAFFDALGCKGCGVVLQLRHMCMESRGVRARGTITTTSDLRGEFLTDPEIRQEFFSFVREYKHEA